MGWEHQERRNWLYNVQFQNNLRVPDKTTLSTQPRPPWWCFHQLFCDLPTCLSPLSIFRAGLMVIFCPRNIPQNLTTNSLSLAYQTVNVTKWKAAFFTTASFKFLTDLFTEVCDCPATPRLLWLCNTSSTDETARLGCAAQPTNSPFWTPVHSCLWSFFCMPLMIWLRCFRASASLTVPMKWASTASLLGQWSNSSSGKFCVGTHTHTHTYKWDDNSNKFFL